MPDKIFLLGLPGAGKTTLGKKLAADLKYEFVDLDDAIEKANDKSIGELFELGEPLFRLKETEALREVIANGHDLVIACGGGTPCFNDNLQLMKKSGATLFLDMPLDLIASRIENQTHRPLMQGSSFASRLLELSKARRRYYIQADLTFSDVDLSSEKVIAAMKGLKHKAKS